MPSQFVVDPADYERTGIEAAKNGGFLAGGAPPPGRWRIRPHRRLRHRAVATWTASQFLQDEDANFWPPYAGSASSAARPCAGENPDQRAPCTSTRRPPPALHRPSSHRQAPRATTTGVDADAALRAAYDFDEPAVHTINPCGNAVATPVPPIRLGRSRRLTPATRCPHTVA